jgi:glycosyltransferase involved in cell wall biosynthesis
MVPVDDNWLNATTPADQKKTLRALEMIAIVIPTYRARSSIVSVINRIDNSVGLIVVVDDCCPEGSGEVVKKNCDDERIVVIRHEINQGVGGAFLTGMSEALKRGAEIVVKVDADGQMDPALVPLIVRPIRNHGADYVKGNRFYFISNIGPMPKARIFGNLFLSFLTKLASGYWNIMDPTNGFLAIHASVAKLLRPNKVARRFFFESDMLYHLSLIGAKVMDLPMTSTYGDEVSNLKIGNVILPFLAGNLSNTMKRIVYKYFIRDFSVASLELLLGIPLIAFGFSFGLVSWISHGVAGTLTPLGTIMLSALSFLTGLQLLLAFINYDINTMERSALHPLLGPVARVQGRDHERQEIPG